MRNHTASRATTISSPHTVFHIATGIRLNIQQSPRTPVKSSRTSIMYAIHHGSLNHHSLNLLIYVQIHVCGILKFFSVLYTHTYYLNLSEHIIANSVPNCIDSEKKKLEDILTFLIAAESLVVIAWPELDVHILEHYVGGEALWIGLVPFRRGEICLLVPVELEAV